MNTTPEYIVTTPAGGGEITPAPVDRSTSQAFLSGEATGVVEQPAADELPPLAGSNEIHLDELFSFDLPGLDEDDDTDPPALARANRMVFSASSDGQVTMHRRHSTGLALTASEAREAYEFLAATVAIWGKAL